jgi:hypothetical protein
MKDRLVLYQLNLVLVADEQGNHFRQVKEGDSLT